MSVTYEILVAAEASPILLSAMSGFEVRPSEPGETRLVGPVVDDAALQALLQRLQSLRVALLELRRLDSR
jgi:hypothetical protein